MTVSSSRSKLHPDRASAGARAEALAADHLRARGLAIVARNYRTRFGEIDLVARDGAVVVFVEVRMRRSASFGGPLASITQAKRRRLALAARGYLAMLGHEPPCRFDAIVMRGLDASTIEWHRDVLG
ncbi:MAG TPA: YraN family protein [Casimicrobiaceae bacterium]